MTQVKRIYVEKKPEDAVAAKDLLDDIHLSLIHIYLYGVCEKINR